MQQIRLQKETKMSHNNCPLYTYLTLKYHQSSKLNKKKSKCDIHKEISEGLRTGKKLAYYQDHAVQESNE